MRVTADPIPTADSREQEHAPVLAVTPRSRVAGLIDRRTARVIGTLAIFAAIAAFIYGARRVLVVFLFAIFVAYLLNPAVSWVERRSPLSRNSRMRAILQVYVVMAILVAVLFTVVGPPLVEEGRKLGRDLPGLMQNLSTGHLAAQIGAKRGWSYETQQRAQELLAAHRDAIVHWAQSFGSYAASLAVNAIWIILIPILAIFFLRDGWKFADAVIDTTDRWRQKQFLRDMIADLDHMLAHYIRAQLVLAALSLVAYTAVLSIFRMPYAIVLGALGGVLEFVPVVGPLAAAAAILGVAFLTSYKHILLIALFLGAWRLVQDYVSAPRIMGRSLELHPLAALFAVLAGGELAGVIGVFLSIPVMATLRIIWKRWRAFAEPAAAQNVIVKPVRPAA